MVIKNRIHLRFLHPKIWVLSFHPLWLVMRAALSVSIWERQKACLLWSKSLNTSLTISTLLFNPLKGEQTVDVSLVTLAIAQLAETNRDHSRFTPIIHGKLSEGREPDEIIIICLDQSWSMEESGEFPEAILPSTSDEDPITRVFLSLSFTY